MVNMALFGKSHEKPDASMRSSPLPPSLHRPVCPRSTVPSSTRRDVSVDVDEVRSWVALPTATRCPVAK